MLLACLVWHKAHCLCRQYTFVYLLQDLDKHNTKVLLVTYPTKIMFT